MKYIQNDFTKELSELCKKHDKSFKSDNSGIYVIDNPYIIEFYLTEAETASEDFRNKLITIINQ